MRRRLASYSAGIIPNTNNIKFAVIADFGMDMTGYTNQQIIDSIRLIVDETACIVLTSSMQKENIDSVIISETTKVQITFNIPTVDPEKKMQSTDAFTIEVDTGDNAHADHEKILDTYENLVTDLKEREKLLYSAHFEDNTDGDNTYTMVLPVIAGVNATTETVTTTTD
jgi:hypothetical protein